MWIPFVTHTITDSLFVPVTESFRKQSRNPDPKYNRKQGGNQWIDKTLNFFHILATKTLFRILQKRESKNLHRTSTNFS
jgi:hypothetical protein